MEKPETQARPAKALFDEAFLRKLERLALLSRRSTAGQLQGERRSPKRGQSVEFSDFRPYAAGDDFRRIDWNAYARLERFFIKLFVEEEDLTVHFLIDASKSMDWGQPKKIDYALRAAGALGFVALVGLDRVTITALGEGEMVAGRHLPALRGKQQAMHLFSFLQTLPSQIRQTLGREPAHHLGAYAANTTHTGPLVLISDLMHDSWLEGVNRLAGRGFEVTVLHVLSPDEVNPEISGDFRLLDSENHQEIDLTADFETLERYRQGIIEWRAGWRQFCNRRGAHYVPVETSLPLEDLLFTWMRKQGVLR